MHLLVTGVSGFVGCRLAAVALDRGHRVTGVCLGERRAPEGVSVHEVNVLDGAALAAVVAAENPDVVIHLAALSHVGRSWNRMADYFAVNFIGTENLLDAAGDRRVVFASSAEVYGYVPPAEQPIAENRALAPRSPYALTKAAAERLALARGAVVARTFNMIGAGQAPEFALPSFALQLAAIARGEHEPALSVGNLAARRDFFHVADGVDAYLLLAERGVSGEAYNVGSGTDHSIEEVVQKLCSVAGLEVRIEVDPARVRPVDIPLMRAGSDKIRALGWQPKHDFESAVRETWTAARDGAEEVTA
ncbi:MAG: GDP-mannose 4,6-dehydratase [Acidobacteriota bacterium]